MHSDFLTADMNGKFICAFADFSAAISPISQNVT